MRNIHEVLRQKEAELALVARHVSVLRLVIPLLEEDSDKAKPNPAPAAEAESPIFRPVSHPLR